MRPAALRRDQTDAVARDSSASGRTQTPTRSALVATALWLLHPIQTEAVDYVIQRTELLVSLCYLATLYASIRALGRVDAGRAAPRWLAAGVVACFVGMASKEVMVTAPVMVVALRPRVSRFLMARAVRRSRASLVLRADSPRPGCFSPRSSPAGGRADSAGFTLGLPWYRYLYSQGWAIAHYLLLMVWPSDLRFDYGLEAGRRHRRSGRRR